MEILQTQAGMSNPIQPKAVRETTGSVFMSASQPAEQENIPASHVINQLDEPPGVIRHIASSISEQTIDESSSVARETPTTESGNGTVLSAETTFLQQLSEEWQGFPALEKIVSSIRPIFENPDDYVIYRGFLQHDEFSSETGHPISWVRTQYELPSTFSQSQPTDSYKPSLVTYIKFADGRWPPDPEYAFNTYVALVHSDPSSGGDSWFYKLEMQPSEDGKRQWALAYPDEVLEEKRAALEKEIGNLANPDFITADPQISLYDDHLVAIELETRASVEGQLRVLREKSEKRQAASPTPRPLSDDPELDRVLRDYFRHERSRLSQAQSPRSMIIGKEGFHWREELSENAQKLYELLIVEMGDFDSLPLYAAEDGFDLQAALLECRGHGLLDESIPGLVRIIRREIK
jgi:hypothetical protein